MVYNRQNQTMKKAFFIILLTIMTAFAYAIPDGCYWSGRSNSPRKYCEIQISGNSLKCKNRDGEVIARWTIVAESNDGVISLKSELGASAIARYWITDEGVVYLEFGKTYRSM